MPAPISIVMPTLNAQNGLSRSLPALAEGLSSGLIRELVISDGGSSDATCEIAEKAGAVLVQGSPSRGGQLRRAASVAKGDWLFFLHADTGLPSGWSDVVQAHLSVGRPAWCSMQFDHRSLPARAVAGWANQRARWLGLPYGDQGLLISRADYDAVGGFADIPLMEDVAIARALGKRLTRLPLTVTTSADRYLRDGWVRRGGRNLGLLCQYLMGADPGKLARSYNRVTSANGNPPPDI